MTLRLTWEYYIVVSYKSGAQHGFWTRRFVISGNSVEWVSASARNRPLKIGFDEIESVWQKGMRLRLRFV